MFILRVNGTSGSRFKSFFGLPHVTIRKHVIMQLSPYFSINWGTIHAVIPGKVLFSRPALYVLSCWF